MTTDVVFPTHSEARKRAIDLLEHVTGYRLPLYPDSSHVIRVQVEPGILMEISPKWGYSQLFVNGVAISMACVVFSQYCHVGSGINNRHDYLNADKMLMEYLLIKNSFDDYVRVAEWGNGRGFVLDFIERQRLRNKEQKELELGRSEQKTNETA